MENFFQSHEIESKKMTFFSFILCLLLRKLSLGFTYLLSKVNFCFFVGQLNETTDILRVTSEWHGNFFLLICYKTRAWWKCPYGFVNSNSGRIELPGQSKKTLACPLFLLPHIIEIINIKFVFGVTIRPFALAAQSTSPPLPFWVINHQHWLFLSSGFLSLSVTS